MMKLGIEIMPDLPLDDLVETIQAAEELGFEYCLLADEGLMRDVYAVLALAAHKTKRIRLSPVTNSYTRHPGITAASAATLNEISGGRALVTLVAGGTMNLAPLSIERQSPLGMMAETVEVLRLLWSGEMVTWQGKHFFLDRATLAMGRQEIPIWMAVRGPKLLGLAGKVADGVVLMSRPDVGDALEIFKHGAAGRVAPAPLRVFLDRIVYRPEMLHEAVELYIFSLIDAPPRMLTNMGIAEDEVERVRQAFSSQGMQAAAKLVTPNMVARFQVVGTPDECRMIMQGLALQHDLDVFIMDIASSRLKENVRVMEDVRQIMAGI